MTEYSQNIKTTYEYNEYGNVTKSTQESMNGEVIATRLFEYDDNQNLTKRTVDTGDGTPFVQLVQTYDDKGNLLEKHDFTQSGDTVNEIVRTYQYDEQNRVISVKRGDEVTETYTYEADGSYKIQSASDPDAYSLYNKDGKIIERQLFASSKVIFTYDDDGNLTESTTYSDNEMTEKQVYQLDEHGNAIKVTRVSASGEETVLIEYEYKQYTVKTK